MNRATVDVHRDDASFFLDRFLFCHLFPSPPLFIPFLPIQGFLFSTGLIKPFDSTVHRFARSRSFGSTFRAQSKITTREGLVLPFSRGSNRIFEYILPIISRRKYAVRIQLSPRWIETELYLLKLKILILNRMSRFCIRRKFVGIVQFTRFDFNKFRIERFNTEAVAKYNE